MGTRNVSILGDMSGKIGTVILTTWKEIAVVKSLPSKKGKPSIGQTRQIDLFSTVMNFLKMVSHVIKIGYQLPKKAKMTELNAATSYHMLNAVIGEYPDYSIDLSKVKFSNGLRSTEGSWNAQFDGGEGRYAAVTWELNPFPEKTTQLDDHAVIIFYNETKKRFFVFEGIQRSALGFTFSNNVAYTGNRLFCWIFFTSADGKLVSETEYLGMVEMTG